MKKLWVLCFLIPFLTSCGVSQEKILTQVDRLLTQKQYQSAYALLEKADPQNQNPDLLLKKIQIALNDYVFSENLKIFCFKNIAMNESIEDFRGQKGIYIRYVLDPEAALSALLRQYPQDGRLDQALGEYEYQIYLNHDQFAPDQGLARLKLAQSYLYQASLHSQPDAKSLYHLGLIDLYLQDDQAAEASFKAALGRGNPTADIYYNLAYTQYHLGELAASMANARSALALYPRVPEKDLCAHLLALVSVASRDDADAIRYFTLMRSFEPQDYDTLKNLLTLDLKVGLVEAALPIAQAMLAMNPSNASILQDIHGIYLQYGRVNEYYDFLHQMISIYAHQDQVLGNLYFYQAQADLFVNHSKSARTSLKTAQIYFRHALPQTDVIFQTIQEELKKLQPKKE